MTSEQFLDEGEYVQQLVFVQCLYELCDFVDGLFFHWQSSFHQSGAGTLVCINVQKILYCITGNGSNGNCFPLSWCRKGGDAFKHILSNTAERIYNREG